MKRLAIVVGLLPLAVSLGCGGGNTRAVNNSANGGGSGGGGPVAASITSTITVGTAPSGIAVDSTSNKIYVADFGTPPPQTQFTTCQQGGGDVTMIDGATDFPSAIPIPGIAGSVVIDPVAIALNETGGKAYVLAQGWSPLSNGHGCFQLYSQVLSIDTSSLVRGVAFSLPPSEGFFLSGMAVNQLTSTIYVGYNLVADPNAIVITTNGGHSLIPIPVPPGPIAVNETTNKIYVGGSNGISVIDGVSNSIVSTIPDPSSAVPSAIAVNPTTDTIYVVNSQSNNLTIIDGATGAVTATIPVGTAPSGVDVDPQTNFIYVANAGNPQAGDPGSITVINGVTNATYPLIDQNAKNPVAVAVDAASNKIYVANSRSNNVTVIDGAHD